MRLSDLYKSGAIAIQNGFPCGNWNEDGDGIAQLRPFNVTGGGQIDLSTIKYIETDQKLDGYLLRANDVIFNNTNSEDLVGKTALWKKDVRAVLSNHMTIVRVLDWNASDAAFIALYLLYKWYDGHFKMVCRRHVNQASVSRERLCDLPLPAFSVDEQRQIAAVLSAVQRGIERQERLIALTAELKKALVHKLFTEGTRGEPLKQTEIGPVPGSWKIAKLADIVEYIDYGISQPIPKAPPPGGVKIVSTADITKDGDILYWKIRRLTAPSRTVQRLTLRDGDVLFNWRNTSELIGKTAVFEEQAEPHVFASFVLRIRCDEVRSHNVFLSYLMNYYREQGVFIKLSRRAVNQANYNRNEISVLAIPHPPIDEQLEISRAITAVVHLRNVHERRRDALQALFRTLLHQLMTAQVRVHDLDLSALEEARSADVRRLSNAT